jgi:transcriptional regulator with GAF, ATPase, and Fis domain
MDRGGTAAVRLARALVEMTQAPMAASGLGDVLSEVSVICQAAFREPVAVSIAVGSPASPTMVATASKLAQLLDGAQMIAGEGPSHLAWTDGNTVHTRSLHADERWPRLALRVADSAVCAAVCAPIESNGSVVGTLNVYSVAPELVDDTALETASLLAGGIAAIVHGAQVKEELEMVAAQLQTALKSRATIDQAKGVLMARHGCSAEKAFELLAEASSSANVKLREVAARLVDEAAGGPVGGPIGGVVGGPVSNGRSRASGSVGPVDGR